MNQSPNTSYFTEAINPYELKEIENGPSKLNEIIDKSAAFILRQHYDEKDELKKNIEKCERILDNIDEERIKANDKYSSNSSYKFTAMYLINIASTIITSLIIPIATMNEVKFIMGSINLFANKIPSDIKKLSMNLKDYNSLLDHYYNKISKVKSNLENKLDKLDIEIDLKENARMYTLEEDVASPNATNIRYVSYSDIESRNNQTPENEEHPETREVLHDEDDINREAPAMAHMRSFMEPKKEDPVLPPHKPEFTPMDAVEKAKSLPSNVLLTKYDNNYYLNYGDLKDYMNKSNCDNYDGAINTIIKANNTPDLNPNSLKVLMSASELEQCSPVEKARLENAEVEFEIHNK